MIDADKNWLVVQAKPNAQERAAEHIRQQGAEVYLPRFQTKQGRIGYLFGTYLFAGVDSQWRFLLGTLGVGRVLMNGDKPARINFHCVKKIKERENSKGFVQLPLRADFLIGQKVRLTRGPFVDRIAIYDGSDAQEREYVLLDILGRRARLPVKTESIVTAG